MKQTISIIFLAFLFSINGLFSQEKIWEGTWETDQGTMQLIQKGEMVYGGIGATITFQGVYNEKKEQLIGILQEGDVISKIRLISNGASFIGELIGGEHATKKILSGRRADVKNTKVVNKKWLGKKEE